MLELVDPSERIEARYWDDVELLDSRFAEGDAVRVLGRVERFRGRLQLQVRTVEPAPEGDPVELAPAMRRDPEELEGFLEFLAAEIAMRGCGVWSADARDKRSARVSALPPAGSTATTGTPAGCSSTPSGWRRSAARPPSSIRACAPISSPAAALPALRRPHARARCAGRRFAPTDEGRLLGHVHLGLRLIEERSAALDAAVLAPSSFMPCGHHDSPRRRTRPRPPCSTTRTSSTRRPRLGRSGSSLALTAVVLALCSAALWGTGDFLGGLSTRTLNVLVVLFWSQLVGLLGVAVWIGVSGASRPGAVLLWAVVAGLSAAVGLGCLYRGMAVGAMGIVAPISATSPIVPLVVSVVGGDAPTAVQWVGIALALAGIVLVSREPGGVGPRVAEGVGLALIAALGFGVFLVGMAEVGPGEHSLGDHDRALQFRPGAPPRARRDEDGARCATTARRSGDCGRHVRHGRERAVRVLGHARSPRRRGRTQLALSARDDPPRPSATLQRPMRSISPSRCRPASARMLVESGVTGIGRVELIKLDAIDGKRPAACFTG